MRGMMVASWNKPVMMDGSKDTYVMARLVAQDRDDGGEQYGVDRFDRK